ncbi:VCBS repeat-containing protein [Fulvivirga sp. 29W222]|uniref:VCBS repeat-containing protein n=1 Tax=Fulvivirga marina TaxID=2494733 RepID=A0A937KED1_9BACT|nr:SpvB/TcaC N-terminal domain-containing protein [Fulvivirga marina]MBL6447078.1 VCBS repeat-containing protein [Fulvivirga marina]
MKNKSQNSNDDSDSSGSVRIDAPSQERATKSNAIEIPSISLPKGGGAIKGIDEKFQINSANGTAGFNIPLPLSSGRNNFSPSLGLSYNSGAGNSIFGLGWSVGINSIKRKTDKELPRYQDSHAEDTFMLSGAEDLVPLLINKEGEDWKINITQQNGLTIKQYRPRIEGVFSKIEKISGGDNTFWKVTSNTNVVTFFGATANARIADPADSSRIYEWLPEFSYDNKGDLIYYEYKEENLDNVPHALFEKNRINGIALFTNKYLKKIRYGNKDAFYPEPNQPYTSPAYGGTYFFDAVFDYGEHHEATPSMEETEPWDYRPDAFSSYRSGFEIRTNRRCKRVLMFHTFPELNAGVPTLVRSLDTEYLPSTELEKKSTRPCECSYLIGVTQNGYIRKQDGSYSVKSLPKMSFDYQWLHWDTEIKEVQDTSLVHAPSGLSNTYQWVDLFSEGINGILTEQADSWYYKSNLGTDEQGHLHFTPAKAVIPKPSFSGLSGGTLQLQDLEGEGLKQITINSPGTQGYFAMDEAGQWEPFKAFIHQLDINLSDPNVRMLDINGDGKPEVLLSDQGAFWWWENLGKKGYGPAQHVPKPYDEEQGPTIVFHDREQRIYLADMSGDGLTDIVRIRNGEISYWPNLGYGYFGAKVAMSNSPIFDLPDLYNSDYIHLADISGTGATDIIYLGTNTFKAYLNFSGNSWSSATLIDPFFPAEKPNRIHVTDLLGNGTSCLVWSSPLPAYKHAPMKYIDLMGGKKPHIMVCFENGTGKKTEIAYKSSTAYYLADKKKGMPWITKLPFPVQCVSKLVITEEVTQVRFTSEYSYHHGYYDHAEREFRGFGRVEQLDTEYFDIFSASQASNVVEPEHHQPPVLTKTWYHTGAYINKNKILTQFKKEYWYEAMKDLGFEVVTDEYELPDAIITASPNLKNSDVDDLNAQECREALRACKGMVLRQEVFAMDAGETPGSEDIRKQATPYTVATHNCNIQLIQPRGDNKHAAFVVKESEAITYSYERNVEDPRIAHNLNLEIDDYGNILKSVAIVYPRRKDEEILTDEPTDSTHIRVAKMHARNAQKKYLITFAQNDYTNDSISPDTYLLRQGWQTRTFEVTGLTPNKSIFAPSEFQDFDNWEALEYHKIAPGTTPQKRLIEHIKTKFYSNDLTSPLPDGQLGQWPLQYENYQLAYTPSLLQDLFTPSEHATAFEVTDSDMLNGKFYQDNTNWWIRSGTTQFVDTGGTLDDAKNRFLSPTAYTDPFGTKSEVFYDPLHLFINRTLDALGNETQVLQFDYRTLSPVKSRDLNDNISSIITDELGMVKASSVEGKDNDNDLTGEEGDNLSGLSAITDDPEQAQIDNFFAIAQGGGICNYTQLESVARGLLQSASARMVYLLNQKPVVVASIVREEHASLGTESPLSISFEYSDGFGKVAMKKVQAEAGIAKKATLQPDGSYDVQALDTGNQLRWVGNGRSVLNNKGNPIKQYEPYFSVTPAYENAPELVETGVSPTLFYDSVGRLIRTELPDGTFSKVEFNAWKQYTYDTNDTVIDSNWYLERMALPDNNPEKKAAIKAKLHYDTPSCMIQDTLGRPILAIDHNRFKDADNNLKKELLYTYSEIDIEGNILSITDARGNKVMEYRYDMLGHRVTQKSMDAGRRWMLSNVLGNPVKSWDERKYEFSFKYDALHRPTEKWVRGGEDTVPVNILFERLIYGEGQPDDKQKNLRGQAAILYDSAGKVTSDTYDFKGNLLSSTRIFAKKYKNIPNWDVSNPDDLLEGSDYTFGSSTEFDAVNRPVKHINPDGSETSHIFNPAGFLEKVSLKKGSSTTDYVQNIDYDEKGQRKSIMYGNNVLTKYDYDPKTFRLHQLRSTKNNNEVLQDLNYTYDPSGNITQIDDKAIPTVFYNNQKVNGKNEYTYDALYRLMAATGREQNTNSPNYGAGDNWNDGHSQISHNSGDPMAMHEYTQKYLYDQVGNILQMKHVAGTHSWTRDYAYENKNNRLVSTDIANSSYTYQHHTQHGYITEMPHLPLMVWNFKEELAATSKQVKNDGTPETTWYIYDSGGQRVRKVTENEASEGNTPTLKDERLYLGAFEVYRHENGLERETLHIMDDQKRIAMIDTETEPKFFLGIKVGSTVTTTIRYQLGNHLGSSSLELNENAEVISYEEHHPYGTTAYQAKNAAIKAAAKRYRYTGMERDEETGLEYHSARYYLPWLGRWIKTDPNSIADGLNIYRYVSNNPVIKYDSKGTDEVTIYHRTTESGAKSMAKEGVKLDVSKGHVWAGKGFYGRDTPNISNTSGATGDVIVKQKISTDRIVDLDELSKRPGAGKNITTALQDTVEGKQIRTQIYKQMYDAGDQAARTLGRKPSDAAIDRYFRDYMDKTIQRVAPHADAVKWTDADGSVTYVVKKETALIGKAEKAGTMSGSNFIPKKVAKEAVEEVVEEITEKVPSKVKAKPPKVKPKGKAGNITSIIVGLTIGIGLSLWASEAQAKPKSERTALDETIIATDRYNLLDPMSWLTAPAEFIIDETNKEVDRRQAETKQSRPFVEIEVMECLFGGPGFCF